MAGTSQFEGCSVAQGPSRSSHSCYSFRSSSAARRGRGAARDRPAAWGGPGAAIPAKRQASPAHRATLASPKWTGALSGGSFCFLRSSGIFDHRTKAPNAPGPTRVLDTLRPAEWRGAHRRTRDRFGRARQDTPGQVRYIPPRRFRKSIARRPAHRVPRGATGHGPTRRQSGSPSHKVPVDDDAPSP
jgi:hypothetical protein